MDKTNIMHPERIHDWARAAYAMMMLNIFVALQRGEIIGERYN